MDKRLHNTIGRRLLNWFSHHQRPLPWRRTDDPYRIWVSEIMLQQTRVDTVSPYYERFLERFPTVEALAEATLEEVLKVWENLGYYARARNLHAAARAVVERWDGRLPGAWDDLIALPGIGRYTAGAILSAAYGRQVPAVDGNGRRVLSRLLAIEEPLDAGETQERLWGLAAALVPGESPGSFNQALMDLGATICKPRRPVCARCPIEDLCEAHRHGLQDALPVTRRRGPTPHQDMTAGVIQDDQRRLLIVQRPCRGLLGGLWKLPGGRRRDEEALDECLRRTVCEELGIEVSVGGRLTSVDHAYTHFRITLHAFPAIQEAGDPRPVGCADWRWTALDRLSDFAFSKADRLIIEWGHPLKGLLSREKPLLCKGR